MASTQDGAELQSTYLGLVDVLLACCYDDRTTQSEPTVESAWTVAKLSGTLSWLEVPLRQLFIGRRGLFDVMMTSLETHLCVYWFSDRNDAIPW